MSPTQSYETIAVKPHPETDVEQRLNVSISVASAVYNVEEYLEDFLSSIENQTADNINYELILIDDGSTDSSLSILKQWSAKTSVAHKIFTKNNGGQASARNVGIEESDGEWITFLDPDDYVSNNYFQELLSAIHNPRFHDATMFVTHLVNFYDDTNTISDTHALRKRFRDGDRLVDLSRSPDFFHMSGPTALVNRAALVRESLRFEEKLRFSFEDAHFISRYLLLADRPLIAYVTGAKYFYRRRSSGNSSIQMGATRTEKYTDVLRYGHLDLVSNAVKLQGSVPRWLQYLFLYDILWYFRGDRKVGAPSRHLPKDVTNDFHILIQEIVNHISVESIHSFDVMGTDADLRDALLLGYKAEDTTPTVEVTSIDEAQRLTMLCYRYAGERPNEVVTYKGLEYEPVLAKTQSSNFLGRSLYSRRYIWIPSDGTFSLALDGSIAELTLGRRPRPVYELRPHKTSQYLLGHPVGASPVVKLPKGIGSVSPTKRLIGTVFHRSLELKNAISMVLRRSSDSTNRLLYRAMGMESKSRYRNAWVLMDRVDQANDNAEHLYRFLLRKKKRINAWFAIRKSSPDWERLSNEGFRLIDIDSDEYPCALINAQVYASSHLDRFITDPLPKKLQQFGKWKFVFLQHGVTKDDQSSWFNSKDLGLLVTATKPEYQSIVGDGSPYKFSSNEVSLTGFPRHDSLTLLSDKDTRKWILISPTWRASLNGTTGSDGKKSLNPDFKTSVFAQYWHSLISNNKLRDFASSNGFELVLLPHPNLVEHVKDLEVPSYVRLLEWSELPYNQVIENTALMVTDYSSTAFEAAYANVPVTYFQFDAGGTMTAGHIYDAGYFDYDRDGFGPVCMDTAAAVSSVCDALQYGEGQHYQKRRDETFAFRDKNNSERVYKAIAEHTAPRKISDVLKALN